MDEIVGANLIDGPSAACTKYFYCKKVKSHGALLKSGWLQHYSPTHSVDLSYVQEVQDEDTDVMVLSGGDTDADM